MAPSKEPSLRDVVSALGVSKAAAKLTEAMGLELSSQRLSNWCGPRGVPVEHGALVERVLGVKRWVTFPDDWFLIWPELVGTAGAPKVPVAKAGA